MIKLDIYTISFLLKVLFKQTVHKIPENLIVFLEQIWAGFYNATNW